jgi:hypothetical protein
MQDRVGPEQLDELPCPDSNRRVKERKKDDPILNPELLLKFNFNLEL